MYPSSDSDVEDLATINAPGTTFVTMAEESAAPTKFRGGSRPGEAPNRDLDIQHKWEQVDRDFFVVTFMVLAHSPMRSSKKLTAFHAAFTGDYEATLLKTPFSHVGRMLQEKKSEHGS